MPGPPVRIRRATPADADVIARHGCRMFEGMGHVPSGGFGELHDVTRAFLLDAIERGEYTGWLAVPEGHTGTVVAGARKQRIDHLVLHPSAEGRPLYERLGFVARNEMRFAGALVPTSST